MIIKKSKIVTYIYLVCFLFLSGTNPEEKKLYKPMTNDYYNYIAINDIKMWVANNGDGSHDPYTDGNGFYWPGGEEAKKAAIFEDGLLWGGVVNGEIRVNGNTHRQGLQAGKILPGGIADNPADPRYRVYKIRKNWEVLPQGPERDLLERDYNEWPVEDGAPWVDTDSDGIFTPGTDTPKFVGDEVLWYVANDLDTTRSRRTYGSDPIGLEFQTLVWGHKESNFLKDVLFKKYTIINKGPSTIDSMIVSFWTDDDLGDASDDYVGCDTLLNLGYTYNGDNEDGNGTGIRYGTPPPSVGHLLIQGPVVQGELSDSARYKGEWKSGFKNLPLFSFFFYIGASSVYSDPQQGVYQGTIEFYRNMNSLIWNGNPVFDPNTGLAVKFCLTGDPVIGEGWYEGSGWPGGEHPNDRRYLMSSGPFTMAPGDTQEVVFALFMAIGDDHINSVTKLKNTALEIHDFVGNQISDISLPGDFQVTLEKNSMRARTDSMGIQASFPNPNGHDYSAAAILKSADNTYLDSLMLYDDGIHHDQDAGDGIWGSIIGPVEEEKEFIISMIASDLTREINYRSGELARFITIGPVTVDDFKITSVDTIPNPGDEISIELTIKNEGLVTGVSNITTLLVGLDDCASGAAIAYPPDYGDIGPGELVSGNHGQTVNFSMDCDDSSWTSLKVEIYSDNRLWWTDTISIFVHGTPSTTENFKSSIPTTFALRQNYPNPFNPRTIINYELPITNYVELTVYNLLGKKVATLVSKRQNAGYYQVEWDATGIATGVYYYRITSESGFVQTKKFVLVK